MEIIIGLLLLGSVVALLFARSKVETQKPIAPYKIETPVPAAELEPPLCGCGRSASGLCTGLHSLSDDAWAEHPENLDKIVPVFDVAPVAETPAPKTCGCGRSPSGLCTGVHKLSADEWAVHPDNPNKVTVEKPVKKARKTKVEAPAKQPKEKAAKPKKAAAIKAVPKAKAKSKKS